MDNLYSQKAEQLKAAYKKHMSRLLELNKKQNALVSDFYKKLEQAKIDKIRKDMGLN